MTKSTYLASPRSYTGRGARSRSGPPITMALITLRSRQPTPLGMGAPTPVRHEIINPGGGQTRVPGPVGVDPDDGHLLTDHARNDQLAAIGRPAGPAFQLRIGRECHEIRAVRISDVNVAGGIQTEVGNPK